MSASMPYNATAPHCPICWESWDSGPLRVLPCNHQFHQKCISSTDEKICAICRKRWGDPPADSAQRALDERSWDLAEEEEIPLDSIVIGMNIFAPMILLKILWEKWRA